MYLGLLESEMSEMVSVEIVFKVVQHYDWTTFQVVMVSLMVRTASLTTLRLPMINVPSSH